MLSYEPCGILEPQRLLGFRFGPNLGFGGETTDALNRQVGVDGGELVGGARRRKDLHRLRGFPSQVPRVRCATNTRTTKHYLID